MTKRNTKSIDFTSCKRRLVQADFTGGDITSDGGAVILREMDRCLHLTTAIAKRFSDTRRKKQIKHDYLSQLRQRVYGICLGYEDLNDHDSLRTDPLIQTALNKDYTLASPSTLCRFENSMGRQEARAIHEVLIDSFIASFSTPPKELILNSMPPMTRFMVARRAGSFMATMIITASFRCMYSVATSCWSVICEGAR
jgi:hypothetical protein